MNMDQIFDMINGEFDKEIKRRQLVQEQQKGVKTEQQVNEELKKLGIKDKRLSTFLRNLDDING